MLIPHCRVTTVEVEVSVLGVTGRVRVSESEPGDRLLHGPVELGDADTFGHPRHLGVHPARGVRRQLG